MNVAIVLMEYNPFGGYERQAAMLADALVERGDHVTIVANNWIDEVPEGIRIKKIPMIKLSSWLKVLSFALFSKNYLEKNRDRFDIVIAFDRTLIMDIYRAGNACHKEWLRFRRKVGGVPDYVSISINPMHVVINEIEKRIFATQIKRAKTVVVLSNASIAHIKRYYTAKDVRFVVIPPAVNMKDFKFEKRAVYRERKRRQLGVKGNALMLLHVGSGFRIKGLKNTIEAMPLVLRKDHHAKLVVVGSDRGGTIKCKKLCRRLGVESYVRFVGGVRNVGHFYAAADVFVVPSLFETFGVAAVEALAWGLPVIIGSGAGVSSLVETKEIGRVVDVSAPPYELARMVFEVATEEKRLKKNRHIEKTRMKRWQIASRCDFRSVMNRYFSLIDEAISCKSAEAPSGR